MIIIIKIKFKKTFPKKTLDKVKEIELKIKYTDLSTKEMRECLDEIGNKLLGIKVIRLSKNTKNGKIGENNME